MDKKKLVINIVANFISFAVSFAVSLFLTPYIVENIGKEAYGFFSLGNNFTTYASLATSALNSMASRFLAISIHNGDNENANKYFSSVFYANIIISFILAIPLAVCIVFMSSFIKIQPNIVFDVQILWGFVFLSFLIGICFNIFSMGFFVKNNLYLSSLRNVESQVIRCVILFSAYFFFKPYIWYLGFSVFMTTLYVAAYNMNYTRKNLPELKVNKKYFDIKKIKELITSGMWNTFNQLSALLSDGLDLIICNIWLGDTLMGTLAITKTVPSYLGTIIGMVTVAFEPQLVKTYTKGSLTDVVRQVKFCNKVAGIIASIPVAGFAVLGDSFFGLWLPGENTILLHTLSITAISSMFFSCSIKILFYIPVLVNKLKATTVVIFASGVINLITVFLLLKFSGFGVYAVAGVSCALNLIRNFTFTPIYAAYCLNVKWRTFYPDVLKGGVCSGIIILIGYLLKSFFVINSWIVLIMVASLIAAIGLAVNFYIILSKEDRNRILAVIKQRFARA